MRLRSSNRLSTDLFAVDHLRLNREWQKVGIDEKIGAILETYVGTHIDIHPDDVEDLERVGRALSEDGRLVRVKAKNNEGDAKDEKAKGAKAK